jgi:hypothetical protein
MAGAIARNISAEVTQLPNSVTFLLKKWRGELCSTCRNRRPRRQGEPLMDSTGSTM